MSIIATSGIFIIFFICRVNKKWKALLKHRSIWTSATVSKLCGDAVKPALRSQLVKLMKAHFGPELVYLDIDIMNAAGLRFLNQKCPNLISMVLTVENQSLDLSMIPSRLTFLELCFDSSGYAPHDWWLKVNREHFPNLKSLAIKGGYVMVYPPKHWHGHESDYILAFRVFLSQIGQFLTLRHLELNLPYWNNVFWRIDKERLMHGLTPLASRLESFCVTDLDPSYWVPKQLLEYIGDEMNLLKHLKVSVCTQEDNEEQIRCLKHLARLPQLETLYLMPQMSMDVLKPVLPLFPKLKDLHLYDLDKKLQVYEWDFDERDRYRPIKRDNSVAWKSVVGELKAVRPDVRYHLIQNKNNHRMTSAFC